MPKRLALPCILSLVLSTSAVAQSQNSTAPPGSTLWDHNGSVVYLVANGSAREFYYDQPRPGMVDAGARPGSLLFRGQTTNGEYVGTAFIFVRGCGQFPYQVSGPILDNYERVVLTGQAPRVGPNCQIQGYLTDRLEFTLLKTGSMTETALHDNELPTTGYDSTWYISNFWSGEYPGGFSVTSENTVVLARANMNKAAPRDVACELPYLAVIHPWNASRITRNKIVFLSATKIVLLFAKEAFEFEGYRGRTAITINVSKGNTIEYIRNDSEGAFEVRISGRQYTASQSLFYHVEEIPGEQFHEDDWVLLSCDNGNRAYIYTPDLIVQKSNQERTYISGILDAGPGLAGYGNAHDLTSAEARQLETDRSGIVGEVTDCGSAYEHQRYRDAELCWRAKAQKGDLEAQFQLGKLYYEGGDIPADKKQAAAWFTTAAERGHVGAQGFLALMYLGGDGVSQSPETAIKWYETAARGGDLSAALNLAFHFKQGQLLPHDAVRALYWCNYYVDRQRKDDLEPYLRNGCDNWVSH